MKPKCFDENNVHNGDYLKEMARYDVGWNVDHVVSWCPLCGAIAIDEESDGRRFNKVVKMNWPDTTRKGLKNG